MRRPTNELSSQTENQVGLVYFTVQNLPKLPKSGREYALSSQLSFPARGLLVI